MLYDKELYHYVFLHFPIALFITGYMFDLLSFMKPGRHYKKFSNWNIVLGVFWGIITIITGFITDNDIGHMENFLPIWTTHGTHMIVSVFSFIIFLYLKKLVKSEKIILSSKLLLFIHTLLIIFFIHGAQIGAKLADRL